MRTKCKINGFLNSIDLNETIVHRGSTMLYNWLRKNNDNKNRHLPKSINRVNQHQHSRCNQYGGLLTAPHRALFLRRPLAFYDHLHTQQRVPSMDDYTTRSLRSRKALCCDYNSMNRILRVLGITVMRHVNAILVRIKHSRSRFAGNKHEQWYTSWKLPIVFIWFNPC